MASTGVGNPITAVLMAFRAMDTLLEAIVLLLALIGVWSLAPDRVWGGRPGPRYNADPDGILAFIARVLPPIGIIVGIYIFWVGADDPGGKFQGATIVAAMWLLVLMAGLADAPPISRRLAARRLVAGPVVFIAIGVVGVADRGGVPRLSRRLGEAADPRRRVRADAVARADARADHGRRARARGGSEPAGGGSVNAATLFGLLARRSSAWACTASSSIPQPLRKILAFNVIGSGVFLLFGAIARRGAALGLGGDPVPQALLITGIVVAFSATALAVTVLLRLFDETGLDDAVVRPGRRPRRSPDPAKARE